MKLILPLLFLSAACFGQDSTRVGSVVIVQGTGITLTRSDTNTLTITATEIDASTTNEGISIPPAPGLRVNLLYDGRTWSQDNFYDVKICLHFFYGTDGWQSLWVQRFDMTETKFQQLADFLSDSLVTTNSFGSSSSNGGKTWTVDTFHVYFADQPNRFPQGQPVNLGLAMDRIAQFFKQSKPKKK